MDISSIYCLYITTLYIAYIPTLLVVSIYLAPEYTTTPYNVNDDINAIVST